MTPVKDAKLIVPQAILWVSMDEDKFEPHMRDMVWNDMLTHYNVKLPVSSVKIGVFDDVFRKGKVCRPVASYLDFRGNGIAIIKGKKNEQ